ncbi:MAG: hypothetical protein E7013_03445 [Alphaproteobacteria bacterium]|nr:hypothetical protein [Alphaproteobacteria bacterium]
MGSSNLESFLSKEIVFSTNNRFSTLLSKSGKVSISSAKKESSSSKPKKETSSIQILQAFKSGKSSL